MEVDIFISITQNHEKISGNKSKSSSILQIRYENIQQINNDIIITIFFIYMILLGGKIWK